jgi:RNA repair pathway DNA polymerase beta family
MALRLGGLSDLDVLSVPLPAGTEITTRVDREIDGVTRPRGVVGRVRSSDGERVEVTFLDGTRGALRPCVVLDARVGSQAWGLADSASDEDHRGVFVLPMPWTTGLVDPPLDLVSLDGSSTYWEIGKAVRQALRADPNTLEMLFAEVSATDPIGEALLEGREAFLSREIYGSFGRYALSQLDRLEHNQRLADHRGLLLGWLAEDPTLTLDATATRLAQSAAIAAPTTEDAVRRGRDYIKQLYRSMYDQGRLTSNDWTSLVAFASRQVHVASLATETSKFAPPRDLRPKNAYNLIRLLDLAIRLLRGEPPSVRVSEALRPTLLAIKQGQVAMSEVVRIAKELTPALEAARDRSPLPLTPDIGKAEALLRRARELAARRWVSGEPGPWGKDAAEPPQASFDTGEEERDDASVPT